MLFMRCAYESQVLKIFGITITPQALFSIIERPLHRPGGPVDPVPLPRPEDHQHPRQRPPHPRPHHHQPLRHKTSARKPAAGALTQRPGLFILTKDFLLPTILCPPSLLGGSSFSQLCLISCSSVETLLVILGPGQFSAFSSLL